jgi:fumarylpyruvate hydrolase
MPDYVVPPPATPAVPVLGGGLFPVRRIFCIGKNYADHVKEMGGDPADTPPVFFTKPADAVICPSDASPAVAMPPRTQNLHYEGEIVLALSSGGRDLDEDAARRAVFGCALGCDLTRRDLQHAAKEKGAPWDMAKGFDESAVMGPITRGHALGDDDALRLLVNDELRQQATVGEMIFPPARIISELSTYVTLAPGDLVYTGTPKGVGALVPGDRVRIELDGLEPLSFRMA